MKKWWILPLLVLFSLKQSCSCKPPKEKVSIDGSSTVYVISEAIAEEYQKHYRGRVSIGISGTGGGFKKLCSGRIHIIGASRTINEKEQALCKKNGVIPTEFAIALDGIVVAVNVKNNWVHEMDIATLKKIFEPKAEGHVNTWSDVNSTWPARNLALFAPGISSGTYDYFTQAIVGKEHASRGDITSSEDDNVLVHGVRSNIDSIGFFSFAYYRENHQDLKALFIIAHDNKKSLPTEESIRNGDYKPLSRPVYIYANQPQLSEVEQEFLKFYLENSSHLAHDVGFVPLHEEALRESLGKLSRNENAATNKL